MKQKVLAINSSKRKGNTYSLLKQIKGKLKHKDIDVEIIHLFEYRIDPCIGCERCLRNGSCFIKDDVEVLMQKMVTYDGIIMSTPVYMNNVSGKLKTFVDRTCRWVHRPELISIPMLFVITTAASGGKRTLDYLENISIQWGAFPTDSISRKVNTLKVTINEKEYKKFLRHLSIHKGEYKPKLGQLIQFQVQKVLAEKILIIDKEYWEMKGWIDKDYFINAKINWMKRLLANSFYNFLSKRIKKVK